MGELECEHPLPIPSSQRMGKRKNQEVTMTLSIPLSSFETAGLEYKMKL